MIMSEVLVKEYRGDIVENMHRGSIAVISATGETIAYIGDIEKQIFMRSASKPIQIIPTLLAGLHEKYELTKEEVAILNSSHWGSLHHMYALNDIAEKTGIDPEDMIMNPARSISGSFLADKLTKGDRLHPESGRSKLLHCCSGKHFGLMMLQKELTGRVHGYQEPSSPVQSQILSFISMLSQTPTYKISLGTDGCGVPVFALPMRNIALAYAKLASPFNLSKELTDVINYNLECINEHPEMINDFYTPSYYINKNSDMIMKDGSRGVICMAIKSRKLGIVVKLEDGWSDEFQGIIIASILEQLKYEDAELIEELKNVYKTKLYNDCGDEVGHAEVCFELNISPAYFEDLEEFDSSNEETNEPDSKEDEGDSSLKGFAPVKTEPFIIDEKEERNRRSILGQTVVLPSQGPKSVIMNPMVDTAGPVKSANVISTIPADEADDDIEMEKEEE